jgi:hypothetical protein
MSTPADAFFSLGTFSESITTCSAVHIDNTLALASFVIISFEVDIALL